MRRNFSTTGPAPGRRAKEVRNYAHEGKRLSGDGWGIQQVGEKWERVRGFGNKYFVSEMGLVKNWHGKILRVQRDRKGKPAVMLGWDRKSGLIPVERLVRQAFPKETVISNG